MQPASFSTNDFVLEYLSPFCQSKINLQIGFPFTDSYIICLPSIIKLVFNKTMFLLIPCLIMTYSPIKKTRRKYIFIQFSTEQKTFRRWKTFFKADDAICILSTDTTVLTVFLFFVFFTQKYKILIFS